MGGGLVQLIAIIVGYYTKKKELIITDDAGLRQSLQQQVTTLMEERKTLVGEVRVVSDKCTEIETSNRALSQTNRELNAQMLKIQNDAFQSERTMRIEIDDLTTKVRDLTAAKEELEHLRNVVNELKTAKQEVEILTQMVNDLKEAKDIIDEMLKVQTEALQIKLNEANIEITRLKTLVESNGIKYE